MTGVKTCALPILSRFFSNTIDDYFKSESANRIPKKTIKFEKKANKPKDFGELFLLTKSNEGITMNFPKLPHNFLIKTPDVRLLNSYKEKIKSLPELEVYCDGIAKQKV